MKKWKRAAAAAAACMILMTVPCGDVQGRSVYEEAEDAPTEENGAAAAGTEESGAAADGTEESGAAAAGSQAEVPAELQSLYAQSAVLIDGDSGRVLFSKNGNEQKPMASTTKIMTCILALELGNMEDTATASSYAASMPQVHLGVSNGEEFKLKDLLYSLMLESHNDAAVVIAEHIGGSVEGFAALMNEKAKELGCENTYFITPNGLDAQDETGEHSTTAEDLAHIMKYCIMDSPKKDEFLEITQTVSYTFTDLAGNRSFSCNNHNAFLRMMDGALSGKTGFTGKAGYCYVGALKRDGKTFIVALLACGWPNNKTYKWSDTKKLMTYGLENYEYRQVWEDQEIPDILVEDGITDDGWPGRQVFVKAGLESEISGEEEDGRVQEEDGTAQQEDSTAKKEDSTAQKEDSTAKNEDSTAKQEDRQSADVSGRRDELKKGLLLGKTEQVTVECDVCDGLTAPVKAGTEVGSVRYYLGDELIYEEKVVTKDAVDKIDFPWCFEQIIKQYALMKKTG